MGCRQQLAQRSITAMRSGTANVVTLAGRTKHDAGKVPMVWVAHDSIRRPRLPKRLATAGAEGMLIGNASADGVLDSKRNARSAESNHLPTGSDVREKVAAVRRGRKPGPGFVQTVRGRLPAEQDDKW